MKPHIRPNPEVVYTTTTYSVKHRYKQPKPFLKALPYSARRAVMLKRFGSEAKRDPSTNFRTEDRDDISARRQQAYNKAYDRFVAKLGDSSSFGATLTAERRETYGMIRGFVVSLFRSVVSARRGDIPGVLHNLGFNPPLKRVTRTFTRKRRKPVRVSQEYYTMPDGRSVIKKASSTWLLWSYGVSPLLSDIQNATEIFIRSVPDGVPVRARATVPVKVQSRSEAGGTRQIATFDGSIKAGIDAYVVCENYDLWLLNQLGLVNPLQWANEAVPFSFVIDWASNWSSVINSLTDFVGLTFTRSSNSTKIELIETYANITLPPHVSVPTVHGSYTRGYDYFVRSVGVPKPKLLFKYETFEWRRALNAISLLVGFLPNKHKN